MAAACRLAQMAVLAASVPALKALSIFALRRAKPVGAGNKPGSAGNSPGVQHGPIDSRRFRPSQPKTAARRRARPASGRSRSAVSASSTATSAPARSTPCAKRCWRRSGPTAGERAGRARHPVADHLVAALVVTAKYVLILLRADNNGEGGTLALMALASRALARQRRRHHPARHHRRARCSTATPSSRRRFRCCRRSKAQGGHARLRRLRRADHGA